MNKNNIDFLRFSSYSIKELITRKLSLDSNFTDLIYEGSNLAILIDIFSYMAQCLMYSLNSTAAESMFADTQLYENMNRLVKFIDYHPHGIGARTMTFVIDNANLKYNDQSIYNYSFIDTGLADDNGKAIFYSTALPMTTSNSSKINTKEQFEVLLYNGKWKQYSTVFTSSGKPYLTFVLAGLKSSENAVSNTAVADKMIHVYVDESIQIDDVTKFYQYQMVEDGVFIDNDITNGSNVYNSSSKIFDLRLNESKTYEITFGNGYTGQIPKEGASIYIFYLDANGPHEKIGIGQIYGKMLQHGNDKLGIDLRLFKKMFPSYSEDLMQNSTIYTDTSAKWRNITPSTDFISEENVSQIRRNAPQWFKTGNRLVTASDYMYFFKNKNTDTIIDAVCQNNYQYITTFYKWLYNLGTNGMFVKTGIRKHDEANVNYYVNQNKIIKHDYKWSDAADANNVYIWIKMRNDSDILKSIFNADIENMKEMTHEVVYLNPLTVLFAICAQTNELALAYFNDGQVDFDNGTEVDNYIEITLDDNCLYSNIDIKSKVASTILNFFDESLLTLGQLVNFSKLVELIYDLGSIANIRTIYSKDNYVMIKPGISFATWTSDFIDIGDDLDVSTSSKQLEPFLFPTLYNSNSISKHIKIIRKSINNINTITY